MFQSGEIVSRLLDINHILKLGLERVLVSAGAIAGLSIVIGAKANHCALVPFNGY